MSDPSVILLDIDDSLTKQGAALHRLADQPGGHGRAPGFGRLGRGAA